LGLVLGLDLLKVDGVYNKDGGPIVAGVWWSARVSQDVDDGLHVFVLDADQQRDVPAPQEATCAGDTRDAVIVGYQLFNHGSRIYVSDDSND
jgi:hypothetical protein